MTDGNMFCFQCEQTAGCTACTGAAGVCGKTADAARLQDELTGALVALARAESGGRGDSGSDGLMLEGMFACVSNVSFDPEAIAALERRVRAKAIALGEFDPYDMGELWDAQEDIRSLKSLLLFGMRGV
ncbi:MAG: hydroxylamine reductase, partial [Senegalimassilia sp.]|nr:hydroxylamine reductase [Senegalimassilia sp.]